MNKTKKIICLVLAVLTIAACFALPGFAAKKGDNVAPLSVTLMSNKSAFNTMDCANLTLKITNVSKSAVKNIVVAGNSKQFRVVGDSGKKTVSKLEAGKSVTYCYKIVIARDEIKDAKRFVQNAVYYQHRLLNPAKFKSYSSTSGNYISVSLNLLFGAWDGSVAFKVYYGVSQKDFNGATLKKYTGEEKDSAQLYKSFTFTSRNFEWTKAEKGNTLGSTISVEDFQIKVGTSVSHSSVSNEFDEHYGDTVVVVPVTIKNISSETKSFGLFDVEYFGSKGVELDEVDLLFDDSIKNMKKIKPGSSMTVNCYLLYDGDGKYSIDFGSLFSKKVTVSFYIKETESKHTKVFF